MFVFMLISGLIGIVSILFGYQEFMTGYVERERANVRELILKCVERDINSEREINSRDTGLNGFTRIEDYCKANGFMCRGYRWVINIGSESFDGRNIYFYKTIQIFDERNRNIYTTSNRITTEKRLSTLDSIVGSICTTLYNYQVAMREKASLDLNFLAMDDGSNCVYDGVNSIQTASGNTVSKQIACSGSGFVKIRDLQGIRNIVGDLGTFGDVIEIANNNAMVNLYCNTPRDKVVIRYMDTITVCCGS